MENALWALVGVVFLVGYLVLKELGIIREELQALKRHMETDDGEFFQGLSLPNKILRQVTGIRHDLYMEREKKEGEK